MLLNNTLIYCEFEYTKYNACNNQYVALSINNISYIVPPLPPYFLFPIFFFHLFDTGISNFYTPNNIIVTGFVVIAIIIVEIRIIRKIVLFRYCISTKFGYPQYEWDRNVGIVYNIEYKFRAAVQNKIILTTLPNI